MLYSIVVHKDAKSDLDALLAGNLRENRAAARMLALMQELNANQALLDTLTDHGFGSDRSASYHVSKWQQHWRKNIDLWRLKIWDLEAAGIQYRIIYAYEIGRRRYHVLGVLPRSFDYDLSHPLSQRIKSAYDAI